MSTAVGAHLALPLLYVIVKLIGVQATIALAICALAALLLLSLFVLYDLARLRRLKRSACDDAVLYARKARIAYDQPDFGPHELAALHVLCRRRDLSAVQRTIAASAADLRAHEQRRPPEPLDPKLAKILYAGTR